VDVDTTTFIEGWHDFFVAEAGASAALAGLVFVAVSINVASIVHEPRLATRAGITVTLLLNILLISTVALISQIEPQILGALVLVIGGGLWVFVVVTAVRQGVDRDRTGQWVFHAVLLQIALLPLLIGGIVLATGGAAGLFWVAAGFVLSFCVAVLNAWVLLIEILR
jgi:modulator of FtsH protease